MRVENFQVDTVEEALAECSFEPFTCVEVDGGFKCFESESDFDTWNSQE